MKNLQKIWPVFLIAFISWYSYILWLEKMPKKVELSNSIEAQNITISSKVSGRIKAIYIDEGSKVKKGQKILELEGDEIIAQLEQSKAALEKSIYELKDLEKGYRKQEIAQAVHSTKSGEQDLEKTKAKLEKSEIDYKRMKKLFKDGAISKNEFEKFILEKEISDKEYKSSTENLAYLKENENLIKEGSRVDLVNAARAQVRYHKAKVKEYTKYSNELVIVSPADGEISSFDLEIGENISSKEPVATITNLNDIYVRVYLPSNFLGKIKNKQAVKIVADSFPDETFKGFISYIGSTAEFTPRNVQTPEERSKLVYPVKIQIENKENKLKNGMYVTLKI